MGLFDWQDKLSCENEEIDEQHKTFFKLAMKLKSVDKEENNINPMDEVMEIIKDIYNYADYHFKAEEEMAIIKQLDYSQLPKHRMEHSKFLSKLQNFKIGDIRIDPFKNATELSDFAVNWMENHILEEDLKLFRIDNT